MTRKSAAQDCLRLLVDPLQKVSPASGDIPRKNVCARPLPAAFSHQPRGLSRRPVATTRKSAAQDCLRLLVDPLQKVSPASGDIPRKNVCARPLPAAFSHQPRGLSSDPLQYPKKVQLRTAFSFWSIPCEKSHQPSEMCLEKRSHQAAFGFWSILCGKPLK